MGWVKGRLLLRVAYVAWFAFDPTQVASGVHYHSLLLAGGAIADCDHVPPSSVLSGDACLGIIDLWLGGRLQGTSPEIVDSKLVFQKNLF